jgi:nicotinate-nucleotide adenylyltransferase
LTSPTRRVGVFGSAFDPPHLSHIALVRAAITQLGLDAVRVLPTGYAWHKNRPLSPAAHRLAMARLAFADEPLVQVDDRELHRPGPTYTIDTLHELQAEMTASGGAAELYLILGGDQARAFPDWFRWQEIVQIAIISIAARGATPRTPCGTDTHTAPGAVAPAPLTPVLNLPGVRSRILDLPPTSLSATEVRQRVAMGLSVDHLVPQSVARYMHHHHLYLTP